MTHAIPDEALELMAAQFRLLGDATRLAILRCLMAGERNVGQVVEATGHGQANVSKHLKLLTEAGFIARRKSGLQVHYRIVDPLIEQLCNLVCSSIHDNLRAQEARGKHLLNQFETARPARERAARRGQGPTKTKVRSRL